MYVLNQKINNLEEKVSVIDNFTQSIFNFISSKEEVKEEVTYSNNIKPSGNTQLPIIAETDAETESEPEPNVYNVDAKENKLDEKSETGESKELLSEMVAELKESLIKTSTENLNNELSQVQELKQELKDSDELFTILNESLPEVKIMDNQPIVENTKVSSKKKEEDLMKLNLTELKSLAKKKNIPVMISNKAKTKSILIQDLLKAT
jgi:hypothetical protein